MTSTINMNGIIPIFRIFDIEKALEFYQQFLGFNVDWEHKHVDNSPIYMQLSFGSCKIHLSEYHGDCCPGGAIRIEVNNIENLHKLLLSKNYKFAKPGLEVTPWNSKEIRVGDCLW